ncbi:MAG: alpha/beta hydrolase [Deltaproteobacteria bacterium CG23_combo_of_CG06-09_8_20_14_all_51_20]|nr:alpha/beta hydrolase [bacterium]OIP42191.1 MAG: alpha/beta hydrolase [Desulfobacteraceae bacterium CG2_30_51_40]PIP47634.1 MAG: alpha/beta hydrolase [Deltaproteobacteria bacterium CG23_combo_of_CG06-09_8_20_14_all_51_20]PIV98613.1 MAG: alpha/beta hydrolase [Deltaproteobacteria bacterium CG17_big_fil_post_rev_8_21_14_2_50_51_6]PIY21851.1 MAG: alpha/beta hydrolase [Deltaproteobacteria bacterium CG_4_10_14_3_um_filter_51_14]
MEHQEGSFKGIRDASIYYQTWLPDDDAKAVLIVVHGLAEHSGRYMNLVNHFVPLGYVVYGIDHIGHGKSEGPRVYVERFEDFTNTLGIFHQMVKEWQPGKPIFLVGHSMGGLIAVIYILEHHYELTGAILSAPSVQVPDNISSATIFLGKIFSTLMPKLGIVTLDAEGVSRDPAVVDAYVNDPLVYRGKTTARLGAELLKAMQRVSAEASKITLPILIIQGGADRLVDPSGAQILHDRVGSKDKTIKVYNGLYHEAINEPEHDQVLSHVAVWLSAHLSSGAIRG